MVLLLEGLLVFFCGVKDVYRLWVEIKNYFSCFICNFWYLNVFLLV